MSEIPAVLNRKVLIASFMNRREAWDVSSRWRSEIRDYGRAVINDVTHEERMRIGKLVVSPDHAVVLISSTFIGRDQVSGSVPVVCSFGGGSSARNCCTRGSIPTATQPLGSALPHAPGLLEEGNKP